MKLNDLKAGDAVAIDEGFTCMYAGIRIVQQDANGDLFIYCAWGRHYFDSQKDETKELIGISWPKEPNTGTKHMSINHLPEKAGEIIDQQGWNADSVIIHLIGFIMKNGPIAWEERLYEYFDDVAKEETNI